MKAFFFGLLSIFLFPIATLAIDASVAATLFYRPEPHLAEKNRPYLELAWKINPKGLRFKTATDKTITARVLTKVNILVDNELFKEDEFILQTPPRKDINGLNSVTILETKRYFVKKGLVKISVQFFDFEDTTNVFTYTDTFRVPEPSPRMFLSNIQLADTFLANDTKTSFLKNNMQVIPLSSNFLDNHNRSINYYIELYNPDSIPDNKLPVYAKIRISKKENELFMPEYDRNDTMKEPRPFIWGSIPAGALKSGNYWITASIEDKFGEIFSVQKLFFQRLNSNPYKPPVTAATPVKDVFNDSAMEQVTVLNLEKTFLAKFTLPQIKSILKMLLPFSDGMQTNTINGFLKKPDEMYMRYFVYNYFQAINNKDPEKAWKEFSEKIKDANKKFSAQGAPGYETERGFIYLRYGPPTDIITVTGETGTLPYQIWQYNNLTQFGINKELANALFLFFKPNQMMSDYQLLHSTVPGEVMNSSWRYRLYDVKSQASSTGFNLNTRAEQYFGTTR